MRHISELPSLAANPASVRVRPEREYWFAMRGVPWRAVLFSAVLLATPGSLFLVTLPGTVADPTLILTIALASVVLAGLGAQLFKNRVVMNPGGLQIRTGMQVFRLRYEEIESVFLAERAEDALRIELEDGEYPMEFDVGKPGMIVLLLRPGTVSRSTASVHNGLPTRYVTFNLFRPRRFLSLLRMRV